MDGWRSQSQSQAKLLTSEQPVDRLGNDTYGEGVSEIGPLVISSLHFISPLRSVQASWLLLESIRLLRLLNICMQYSSKP